MKVLIINGSPRINGNTSLAIKEMEKIFEAQGVDTETVQVGNKDVRAASPAGGVVNSGNASLMILSMSLRRNSARRTALLWRVPSIMPPQTRR